MIANERIQLRGNFLIRVFKNGKLINKYSDHNMIVNLAKESLSKLVAGEGSNKQITKIALGTDGSIPTPSDEIIKNPYVKNIDGFSYPTSGQVKFNWSIASSEANGMSILEFGLMSEDGTLFARKIRNEALAKENDISIEGEWTIVF